MCGIAGLYHLDRETPADRQLLAKMCDALVHRGPDDEGLHAYKNIGIGMRRLSIIDLSSGHQPISNEDGSIWVVLNGEIYNYPELQQALKQKGHVFKTTSDTECIVHLYEEYGEDCLHHLRGMFALAILDQRDRSLFIARDRLGIKPLFYSLTEDKLLFASEMKAILQDPSVSREMDYVALDAFFTYGYIPSPLTIFKSIRKLDPGHFLKCGPGGVKTEQYWDFSYNPDYRKSEAQFAEEFIHLFDEAVRMHLLSDVPLGAFLSGGIDSGMVVALMAHHTNAPVQTFTIGFGGRTDGYLDERPYARRVGERYQVHHREHEVYPRVGDILDPIVRSFDEPFADDSVVPSFYICKLARDHVTVALTGAGGDELFAGYDRYLGLALSRSFQKIPTVIRNRIIRPLIEGIPEGLSDGTLVHYLKRFIRGADDHEARRYQRYMSMIDDSARDQLYSEEFKGEIQPARTEELGTRFLTASSAESLLDRALYQDFKMYLPDDILALADRLSMHHSLELRVPFLDHKVVEYCATIPFSMKIRFFRKKYLLKKIARPYLPTDLINHRKQGFAAPMASWLRHDLKEYAFELLSPTKLRRHGILKPDYVEAILRAHMAYREQHHKLIFSLIIFQRWHQLYC